METTCKFIIATDGLCHNKMPAKAFTPVGLAVNFLSILRVPAKSNVSMCGHLTLRYLHVVFCSLKHLIPQSAFKVGLHFGQVIICRRASTHSHVYVVKEIKTKVNQSTSHWQPITLDVPFIQVPTSCSYNQACNILFQFPNGTYRNVSELTHYCDNLITMSNEI